MSDKDLAVLTIDEIKGRYFGARSSVSYATKPLNSSVSGELTPSGKYIAAEAKKRIGQKIAFDVADVVEEEDLFRLVQYVETIEGEELSERERTAVVAALSASLDHYDILSPLVISDS